MSNTITIMLEMRILLKYIFKILSLNQLSSVIKKCIPLQNISEKFIKNELYNFSITYL